MKRAKLAVRPYRHSKTHPYYLLNELPSATSPSYQPVKTIAKTTDSRTMNPTPFLDISGEVNFSGEEGLLGLAFDPNYASNGRFYINYSARGGSFGAGVSHTAEFLVSADPDIADPTSEATLFTYDKP